MTEHAPVTLGTLLRAGGHELRHEALPPDLYRRVEVAVAQRTRAARAAARGHRKAPRWLWGGVATVCTAALAWVLTAPMAPVSPPASAQDIGEGFTSVASPERWQQAAAEPGSTWLLSIEISQARAAAFGLPYDPGRAADRVRAELLMHASGDVLAVRLVP